MTDFTVDFKKYAVADTVTVDDGGIIGAPVEITVLFDRSRFAFNGSPDGTPIMIYVVNTGVERIGTKSDAEIVGSMIDRGYVVAVFDYLGAEGAVCPKLEYSVQLIRSRLMKGEFFAGVAGFEGNRFLQTVVVPAGYDVSFGNVFFEMDKHGGDGTLEKITEIWNNDFRGTKGDRIIKWVRSDGSRKSVATAFDGTEPVWLNADGTENPIGEYVRVKHTHANDISDCARPDGSPIDLKLYMHIVYPTAPARKVPVMCLASSSEHLCGCTATVDRPHLLGAAFRGYAAVAYDYGYTPMARVDHYEYFDGYPKPGYITGDNPTYSVQFYNDKRMNCAAMRYLRLRAMRDGLPFDTEAIGVYGNSKGGWMGFLGEEHPETMVSRRLFGGHHDETRYENGKTETVGIINGGEPQPWLTYNGETIDSGADFIYCSCGGTDDSMTEGHAPRFISCNRRDSSCYGTSTGFVNVCRLHDIPAVWVDINAPHTIVQGEELNYGYDAYISYFDAADYFLYGKAVKVSGIKVDQSAYPAVITVRFSGTVSKDEAKRITVCGKDGVAVSGEWSGTFAGVEWSFTPYMLESGEEYTVTVPAGVFGTNGKPLAEEYKWSFATLSATVTDTEVNGETVRFTAPKGDFEANYIAVRVDNDGVNRIGAYTADGTRVGFVGVSGKGVYRIDITDYLRTVVAGEAIELALKAERNAAVSTVFSTGEKDDFVGFTAFGRAKTEISAAPDGVKAFRVDGFEADTHFPTETMYHSPDSAFKCGDIVKDCEIVAEDMGRKFTVSLRFYDTVSRYLRITLNNCTSMQNSIADNHGIFYNVVTKAGQWQEFEFDYTVYEPMYGEFGVQKKALTVAIVNRGEMTEPIYFGAVKTRETVTEIEISDVAIVSYPEKYKGLPEGMVDIICTKSPWSK